MQHIQTVIRQRKIQLNNEERRNLQTTLANFKSPQHPSNTLVSTNVVEEGLDVRSCNLVIKFDFPDNFRSYVQSKGRTQDVTRDHLRDCPWDQRLAQCWSILLHIELHGVYCELGGP